MTNSMHITKRPLLFSALLCGLLLDPVRAAAQIWASKADAIERLAPLLDLKPGSTVAEIGAGNGSVALAAAGKVGPAGHVYATEIDPAALEKIRNRVSESGLANLTVVNSSSDDTRLPVGCCDAIYMIGVYHHFTAPMETDASIYRALRPGGRLAVVDFFPAFLLKPWTPKGVPENRGGHGIPPPVLEDELTRSGLKLVQVYDPWGSSWFLHNYCAVFIKPGAVANRDSAGARAP
ncbi:MAG TPA: class I SAM-dependent methyltransferase [Candidatus Acidoferrales bacterium]|nr:class I SAM-dependent methyltransferase [Candidatus Acidoferrales bacterium]